MGWTPPLVRRQLNCLRLWNRLLEMSENRLTRRIFIWDYTKCRNNWWHEVRNILKSTEFGDKYLSALNNTQNAIISIDTAKDKLMRKHKHKWGNDVASQTKLDNYKIMTHEFGAEEYVKFVMSKKLRSTKQDAFLLKSSLDVIYKSQEMNDYVNNALREMFRMRNISYSIVPDTVILDMILQDTYRTKGLSVTRI